MRSLKNWPDQSNKAANYPSWNYQIAPRKCHFLVEWHIFRGYVKFEFKGGWGPNNSILYNMSCKYIFATKKPLIPRYEICKVIVLANKKSHPKNLSQLQTNLHNPTHTCLVPIPIKQNLCFRKLRKSSQSFPITDLNEMTKANRQPPFRSNSTNYLTELLESSGTWMSQ